MYPITSDVKTLFEAENKQVLRITCDTVQKFGEMSMYDENDNLIYKTGNNQTLALYSGSTKVYETGDTKVVMMYSGDKVIYSNQEGGMPVHIEITSGEAMENGFNIDRFSCIGNKLEIGTAIAAEMKLVLDNREDQYKGVVFEGVEMFVEIGIADWEQENPTVYYIPCGYFTPDTNPRRLNTITLHALDRMMFFDKPVNTSSLSLPATVESLVGQVCTLCSVTLAQSIAGLPNASYSITALPETQEPITYRNLIQWCAGLMASNAWIDWNGELRFSWYDNNTDYVCTIRNRFSSDIYETPVSVTGVKFQDKDEDSTVYIAGTDTYALDLSENYLINGDNASGILNTIYLKVGGFTYSPFTAGVLPAQYLWPMDRIVFNDKVDVGSPTLLTNVNLTVNGATNISAVGESEQTNSYGTPNSFTAKQLAQLQKIKNVTDANIQGAVDSATAQITGATGGYVRFIYDSNDKLMEIVIMDTEDIMTATKVWRWNSGGLGYSSNGYNGPYTLAMTQDGAIVANFITTGTMSANRINGGTLTLGGNNNGNGVLQVNDASGNAVVTANNNGLSITKGSLEITKTDASNNSTTITVSGDAITPLKILYENTSQSILTKLTGEFFSLTDQNNDSMVRIDPEEILLSNNNTVYFLVSYFNGSPEAYLYGDMYIGGTLTTAGSSTFNGPVEVNDDLTVNGNPVLVPLSTTVQDTLDSNGNMSLGLSASNVIIACYTPSWIVTPWLSGGDNNWHVRVTGINGMPATGTVTITVKYYST